MLTSAAWRFRGLLVPQWQMVKPRWAGGLRLAGLIFSAGAMGQESGHAYGRARTGSSLARWRGAGLCPGAEPAPLGLRRACVVGKAHGLRAEAHGGRILAQRCRLRAVGAGSWADSVRERYVE